jgi:hypothetical protein
MTSCPVCSRHNPDLRALRRLAPPSLAMPGVARGTDAAFVRRHAVSEGYPFPITLAAEPLAQGQRKTRRKARR